MSELDKKIKDSIRILKMGAQDKTVELSYSGGKGLEDFKTYPKLVRCWLKAGKKWFEKPRVRKSGIGSREQFGDVYSLFVHNVFFDSYYDFEAIRGGLFGTVDCKAFLEEYFKIDLTL